MKQTAEEWFKQQITSCESKMHLKQSNNYIQYFKDNVFVFEQNINTDEFWINTYLWDFL